MAAAPPAQAPAQGSRWEMMPVVPTTESTAELAARWGASSGRRTRSGATIQALYAGEATVASFTPFDPFDGDVIEASDIVCAYIAGDNPVDDNPSYRAAMAGPDRNMWLEAIATEEATLAEMGTFSEPVEVPEGRRAISSRWVLVVKRDGIGNVEKYKARLVACGDMQREGVDYTDTFSPTGRTVSHRLLLSLAVEHAWPTRQFDVSAAYLNGNMKEEMYMRMPNGSTVRVLKSLYGLCQAGHEWNAVLHAALISLRWVRCDHDHAVYHRSIEGGKQYLSTHVDNGLVTGVGNLDAAIAELSTKFTVKNLGAARDFLGIHIERDGETGAMTLTQTRMIDDLLAKYGMSNCAGVDTPINTHALKSATHDESVDMRDKPYRQLVGSLHFLAGTTRPDIAFAVGSASRFASDPKSYSSNAIQPRFMATTQVPSCSPNTPPSIHGQSTLVYIGITRATSRRREQSS